MFNWILQAFLICLLFRDVEVTGRKNTNRKMLTLPELMEEINVKRDEEGRSYFSI